MILSKATIPEGVLDRHLGILGINGSGKTYTAKGAAENLLDRGERICVIDPTGVWYGLKSSATGKSGAYPVVIFGGPHADVQIAGTHGEAIAEAIGTSSTPSIIDVSLMRGGERTRFFADFAETLRIKNKGPLHLFIDEAHLFMPQGRVSDPNSALMLHAANNLISLGRARGLRVTIISQRPAKVHKDSLTQVHSLIAMRLIAPQDRAAVEGWIADQGDQAEGKKIIASLPSLKTGEGWLWAPELSILKRLSFPKIKTFDSSKSPEAGEGETSLVLAPINLDVIHRKLAAIKSDVVANDPVSLKRRIAELERGAKAAAPSPAAGPSAKELEAALKVSYAKGYQDGLASYGEALEAAKAAVATKVQDLIKGLAVKPGKAPAAPVPVIPRSEVAAPPPRLAAPKPVAAIGGFSGPQTKILNALQFWKSMGNDAPSREQVAGVAGYSSGGGSFQNTLSQLRTGGYIDYPGGGAIKLVAEAGTPLTLAEASATLTTVLSGPQRKVIAAFKGADALTREDVARLAGYEVGGGSFQNTISRLNVLGVLHRPANGMLAMSDWAREVLQ